MKEFIEKLIESFLGECVIYAENYEKALNIANELTEEYINTSTDTSTDTSSDTSTDTSSGWIPCSERLPDEHDSIFAEFKGTDKWRDGMFEKTSDDVNVTVKYGNGTVKTKTMHTIDGKWNTDSVVKCEVTHWQPLPAPYKEGE